MDNLLFLSKERIEEYKSSLLDFTTIYSQKLLPVFKNIENEAEKYKMQGTVLRLTPSYKIQGTIIHTP